MRVRKRVVRLSPAPLAPPCSRACPPSPRHHAPQALVDLHGRYFGGREVAAEFFEEERFERRELAPRPEEVRR